MIYHLFVWLAGSAQTAALAESITFRAALAGLTAFGLSVLFGGRLIRYFRRRNLSENVQVKDSEVSRRHAMLEVREGTVVLVDMGATNGTWVGGERAEEAEISNQGEFTLGSTTLMLIITGGATG